MKHAILLAGLLSLSFGANADPVTIDGFTFNDNGPNTWTGELTEWDDVGGAWDAGSVQTNHSYWAEDDNGTEIAVHGFYPVSDNVNKTVTFGVQNGFYFPDTVDEYQADNSWAGRTLLEGYFTSSDGSGSQFLVTGGDLAPYFTGGLFVWNNTLAQVDVSEDGTPQHETGYLNNNWTLTMTATPVSPVPVPAAVWLFGSGLLGMVAVARRRKS